MDTHKNSHAYAAHLDWTGNLGTGTSSYTAYSRAYTVAIDGKPDFLGSADPMFKGDGALHNPEDLLVVAASSCHMLSYLALCARQGVRVLAYTDDASGTLVLTADGGGHFTDITLKPVVTIADAAQEAIAMSLHEKAHAQCYIASSLRVPVHHEATIRVGTA